MSIIPQDPVSSSELSSLYITDISVSYYVSIGHMLASALLTHFFSVSGTLRSNLDPFNAHDDATLWDALKRVYLVASSPFDTPSASKDASSDEDQEVKQFSLDSIIEDEGNNLSVGQVNTHSYRSPASVVNLT